MKMLIWQQVKTPPDEAESHLYKHQQQFLDQNPNTNTSWIPLFLAEREKKDKHKNSNMDQNPPIKLLWFWFWFDLRDRRSFVWDFANKILIQTHKPLRTLENLSLKREWWSEKVNGYLECRVYKMSESVKRIWRWVRVNRHSAKAWWWVRVMEWKVKWVSKVLGLWDEWTGKSNLEMGKGESAFSKGLVIRTTSWWSERKVRFGDNGLVIGEKERSLMVRERKRGWEPGTVARERGAWMD